MFMYIWMHDIWYNITTNQWENRVLNRIDVLWKSHYYVGKKNLLSL